MNRSKDRIMEYLNDHPNDTVLIYGAGTNGKRCLEYIGKADFFVDKRAKEIGDIKGESQRERGVEDEIEGVEEILPEGNALEMKLSEVDAYDRGDRGKHVGQQHHQEQEMLVRKLRPETFRRNVLPPFGD